MRKIWAVIRREFIERVRTKWFWVGTILGPIFFGGLILLQVLLAARGGGERRLVVLDGTTAGFGERLAAQLGAAIPRFEVSRVAAGPGVADSLTDAVVAKRLDGYLLVDDATLEDGRAEYRGSNASAIGDMEQLQAALSRLVFRARLERHGIDADLVRQAELRFRLATQKISGRRMTAESGEQAFLLAFGMAIILFMAILLYGINVMSSVLEEKTTRVVELLVSSLRPFELMLGKVVGAGAVGMVQLSVWAGSAVLLTGQQGRLAELVAREGQVAGAGFQLPQVPAPTLAVFLVYFLLGYFLYSAVFAALGAISSTEQEARQVQTPISLVLMVPYLSFIGILNDPNGPLAVWMTLIPLWSPIAAPVRWAATPIPLAELAASLAILVASVLAVTWVAARIYRVGILMTGKRPSIRELVRWVRVG